MSEMIMKNKFSQATKFNGYPFLNGFAWTAFRSSHKESSSADDVKSSQVTSSSRVNYLIKIW